jgi:hypothetical protein
LFQDDRCLEEKTNEILTAIVHGMTETSSHVRLVATNALLNSVSLMASNFNDEVS